MTHKNIPQTRRKTTVTSSYIKSVSVVSNALGLILVSIAIQCMQNFVLLRKVTINIKKNFYKFGFSRSFTISELKDKVNYNFLEGAKFPKGGHISCDTGTNNGLIL
jgi:hypothetical protein